MKRRVANEIIYRKPLVMKTGIINLVKMNSKIVSLLSQTKR